MGPRAGGAAARDVAGKVALGVLVGGALARLLGALYRRHHLLNSLPGPEARTLSTKGHEEGLRKAGGLCKYLLELHAKHGPVVRLVLGGEVFVSVCDTKILRDLEVVRLDKRIEGLNFLRGLLGPNSVGLMKGQRARERRQLLHNLFTTQKLDALVPHFVRCIQRDVAAWGNEQGGAEFEAQAACREVWMRLNALNVFGPGYIDEGGSRITGLGQAEEEGLGIQLTLRFGEALALLLQERYNPYPALPFVSARWRRRRQLLKEVHDGVDKVVAAHLARRAQETQEQGGGDQLGASSSLARGGDLLSMLLAASERDPAAFTPKDVHDEMTTFLFATFENFVVLSNALYMMSTHPHVQDRLRAEARAVLGGKVDGGNGNGNGLGLGDVQKLAYAQAVVKETLRTVMGTMTWRVLETFGVIRDREGQPACVLPPDTSIIVPMVAIHRQAQYWPDPESFRPERFLADAKEAGPYAMQDPLAFLPFGLGTRRCLGYRFALDIASLVLAMAVLEYQVLPPTPPEVAWTESSFNWYVKEGLHLKLQRLGESPRQPTPRERAQAQGKQGQGK